MEAHTTWQPSDTKPFAERQDEVFDGAKGQAARIVRYDNPETGVLRVDDGPEILFHVNQVWLSEAGGRSWHQLREVLPTSDLCSTFPKDSRVQINARKVAADPFEYQATAVWKEGKCPPDYRTKDWHEELGRLASCTRQRVAMAEPLTTSSTREGVVQEYLSYETGLLRLLDGDRGVALFALESVWVEEGGASTALAQLDDRLLQDFAPVGSKVLPSTSTSISTPSTSFISASTPYTSFISASTPSTSTSCTPRCW